MHRSNCEDYCHLFTDDVALMDVRAPIEFNQGAFPLSQNHPIMNDDERSQVGTYYKQKGHDEAVKLGYQLVSGETKEQRIEAWKTFCQQNPNGYLYCFRGGLRSQITQQWLKESGIDYPYIVGGYKALRRYLIDTLEQASSVPGIVIGGNTGSGKTDLIKELADGIDIEGAAHHRGSSFGRYVKEQRSQINFENTLAIQMLKRLNKGSSRFVYEDEGKTIGRAVLPLPVTATIQTSPVAVIDDPFDIRVERLLKEYVVKMQSDFLNAYDEEEGWAQFSDYLNKGMFNIRKRLGHERYDELLNLQKQAISVMQSTGSADKHIDWLAPLLEQYYDPMYQYQLNKKSERITFVGDYNQVKEWLSSVEL